MLISNLLYFIILWFTFPHLVANNLSKLVQSFGHVLLAGLNLTATLSFYLLSANCLSTGIL